MDVSCLRVSIAVLSSCPDFLPWWAAMLNCKLTNPFLSSWLFGHVFHCGNPPEVLGWIPSTYTAAHNHLNPSPRGLASSSGLGTHDAQAYVWAKHLFFIVCNKIKRNSLLCWSYLSVIYLKYLCEKTFQDSRSFWYDYQEIHSYFDVWCFASDLVFYLRKPTGSFFHLQFWVFTVMWFSKGHYIGAGTK